MRRNLIRLYSSPTRFCTASLLGMMLRAVGKGHAFGAGSHAQLHLNLNAFAA